MERWILWWSVLGMVLLMLLATTASETYRPVEISATHDDIIINDDVIIISSDHVSKTTFSVFEKGELTTTMIKVKQWQGPPRELLIVSPREAGNYPFLLFIHGTMLINDFYSQLFQHIASHGFVVVAPQIYVFPVPPQPEEIEAAAEVANWVASNSKLLYQMLPEGVEGNLTRFAVSGHSRGGKTAFALALGKQKTPLKVKISALVGIDPVAGTKKGECTEPHILTYVPNSLNLSIPVTVIGSGLGNQSVMPFGLGPACGPNGVNHVEFFNECKEATHLVTTEYGHMDLLNENVEFMDIPIGFMARRMCVNGKGPRGPLRTTLGGIVVAFLHHTYYNEEAYQFAAILTNPSVAPVKLYPVQDKKPQISLYAQA